MRIFGVATPKFFEGQHPHNLHPMIAIDTPMRILHLEDALLDHVLVKKSLQAADVAFTITHIDSLPRFIELTRCEQFDLVLADYQLPGFTALDAWNHFPTEIERPPFVLFSGAIGETAAVAAIKSGFADYLSKTEGERLARVILRAIEYSRQKREKEAADAALDASQRQLSALTEHLQLAIEHERKAISREIHDDIVGTLTAAKLDLAWMLRREIPDPLQTHAESALDCVQLAIDACRRLMLNLRPSVLDEGLQPAMQWLVEGFTKRNQIPASLRLEVGSDCLAPDVLLVAFRTVQEGLTNIAKHAQCSTATIDISSHEGALTVEISDNGIGMKPEDTMKLRSFGLRGLQERAQSIGGWLDISSRHGQGTSIVLTIPLNESLKNTGARNDSCDSV